MAPTVQKLSEIGNFQLAEGPHWDHENQVLYFVNIFVKEIHRYVPSTKQHTKVSVDDTVSFIIPVKGQKNRFVISQGTEIVAITWDGLSNKITDVQQIGKVDEDANHRLNDGKADPTGRLWTGSWTKFGEVESSFISLERGKITTHVSKIGLSNGLAFNPDLKKLYYIDSNTGTIDQFDIDLESGTVSNRQVVFTLDKHDIDGLADGMTIDTNGNLWVAVCNSYKVINIDPREPETLLQTINLPAKQITSVAFGGPNLDELYVTSGSIQPDDVEKLSFTDDDGAIFKVTGLNAKGFPGDEVVL